MVIYIYCAIKNNLFTLEMSDLRDDINDLYTFATEYVLEYSMDRNKYLAKDKKLVQVFSESLS